MRSSDANEILRTSGIDALRNAIDNGAEDDRKSSTAGIERKKDRTVKAAVKRNMAAAAIEGGLHCGGDDLMSGKLGGWLLPNPLRRVVEWKNPIGQR